LRVGKEPQYRKKLTKGKRKLEPSEGCTYAVPRTPAGVGLKRVF